jgi:ankyrin repeat protein
MSFEQILEDILVGHNEDALTALETYRGDINKQDGYGCTLLYWGVASSNKVVKKLVEMGANLNIKTLSFGWTALRNDLKAVELLVEAGADPSIKTIIGRTALYWNNLKVVKAGADPSIQNNDGETALDLAIRFNSMNIISEEIPLTKRAQ